MRMWMASAVVMMAVVGAVRGGDPVVPKEWPVGEAKTYLSNVPQPIVAETQRLVERLGSPDYAVREAASKELADKGNGSFPGLWEAVEKSGDAEVQQRVGAYYKRWQTRTPGNPAADAVEAIDRYISNKGAPGNPSKVGAKSDEIEVRLLDLLLKQEKDGPLVANPLRSNDLEGGRARLMMVAGRYDVAEAILRGSIDKSSFLSAAEYAALVAKRRGEAFDPQKELDAAGVKDEQTRNELGMWLFRAKGDLTKASEYARKLPFSTAGRSIKLVMVEAGQFREMADDALTSKAGERFLLTEAVAYLLAGEQEKAEGLLLRPLNDVGANWEKSLIRAGEVEAVIAAARERPEERWIAAVLLCRQLRVREALAVVQKETHPPMEAIDQLMGMGFTGAAKKVLVGIVPDEKILLDKSAAYESDLAAMLDRVGEGAAADKWRARACTLVDEYREQVAASSKEYEGIQVRLSALQRNARGQIAPEVQAEIQNLQHEVTRLQGLRTQATLKQQRFSVRYYPKWMNGTESRDAASMMGNGIELASMGTGSTLERFNIMRDIFSGRYPGDDWLKTIHLDQNASVGLKLDILTRSMQRVRREDLGRKLVEQVVEQTKDPSWLTLLGDQALAGGRPQEAVDWYQKAAVANLTDASLMYRLGVAYTRVPGKKAQGEQLKALVPWLISGAFRNGERVVGFMKQFGEEGDIAQMDAYLSRFGKVGEPEEMVPHMGRLRDAAEKRGDYAQALAYARQAVVIPKVSFSSGEEIFLHGMTVVAAFQRIRALEAWSRKDVGVVVEALGKELENGPPDVEVLEKVWPLVKGEAGARKVLEEAGGRLKAVVVDWPEAGGYGEQLRRLEALR